MTQVVLDLESALDRMDQDMDLFFELVDIFFTDYDATLANLKSAVAKEDLALVEATAHSLKSALGNLSAQQSYSIAAELEYAGRDNKPEKFTNLLSELELAVSKFKDTVEKHRKTQ